MSPETLSNRPLSEVQRLTGAAVIVASRELLVNFVETPLLAACEDLYDRNIRTLTSSANGIDLMQGIAYINIDLNTLSDENKSIADKLVAARFETPIETDGSILHIGSLQFKVNPLTTVSELSRKALEVASRFKKQPMLWAPKYDLGYVKGLAAFEGRDEQSVINQLVGDGYFYDVEGRAFYLSEEHFQKTNAN